MLPNLRFWQVQSKWLGGSRKKVPFASREIAALAVSQQCWLHPWLLPDGRCHHRPLLSG
jgi:hypothetical protein